MMIFTPWTEDQVKSINDFQKCSYVHQFTCGEKDCRNVLIATPNGFICPADGCNYFQNWCHDFMADRSWASIEEEVRKFRQKS